MALNSIKRIPVLMTSIKYCRSSSGLRNSGAGQSWSGIRFLHNLMNALAAQVVRIRNLAESHSLAAHLQNLGISVVVRRRPWLEWAPGPTRKTFQRLGLLLGKETLLATLSDVADPRADIHLGAIHNLNVNCRDSRVPSTLRELLQRFYIQLESGVVVHGTGL